MARKVLAFIFLVGTSPAFAATDASGFEDLSKLEGRLIGALDADVGEPGGPATHLDRRVKLQPCPTPVTIDPPALGAIALRCEPLGWRMRVPLTRVASQSKFVAAAPVQPPVPLEPALIKRGDPVELIAGSGNFTVTTDAVAQEDGRLGGRIRVKPDARTQIVIGQVLDAGRVSVSSF